MAARKLIRLVAPESACSGFSSADRFSDQAWMARALSLAQRAAELGEVPVGALLVQDQNCLAEGWNQPINSHDPTAHAEIIALRAGARQISNYRLPGSTLYVTLEPCAMCAGALIQARVKRIVYGAGDSRNGACGTVFNVVQNATLNHQIEVTSGVLEGHCGQLLKDFFRARRR